MIELSNVSFSYHEKPVLRGINLHIRRGEYIGITGANGSGKTTLAKLLNGLLLPHKGCVMVDGRFTSDRESLLAIRRSVGIVFQNPDAQAIGETVEEDIVFGLENIGVPSSEIDCRIDRYLDMLGIKELRYRNISLLSGGQKQLVNLAAIMAMDPECIVFDEALSMMDRYNRKNVLEIISELNRDGTTIVIITHNPDDLVHCHRIVSIAEGRISLQEPAEEIEYRGSEVELESLPSIAGGIKVQVTHTYSSGTDWEVSALKKIDLVIEKGRISGIIGGIGAGKSTLAYLIAGLSAPTTGRITIEGKPPLPGRNVGMLFQHPEDFFFEKTVHKEIFFGLKNMGLSNDEIERRIQSVMEQVGLDKKVLNESPFHLSSGEQRLAAFACIIAMKPGYIILDEPTAELDPGSQRKVLDVIRRMTGEVTTVCISHRIRDILDISDRIAVLKQGNLVFSGTKKEYLNRVQKNAHHI
ncbi:MAG: energy-coupling factor transporter ATPase [Euryarchaeota archaeon]|nr:energy-coupling factor transporter ATPase [Euryarchaeota archaeon]